MPTAKKAAKSTSAKAAKKSHAAKTPSDEIDQQLARYQSMRDFAVTQEPSGKARDRNAATTQGLPFVIQKHAASHLHYDFRLGWNGVLKSWACAKGPSYFPGDRRLAVQVEDHPIEYGGFEGIIPQGQYGGGTVMLWDQGTWAPQPGHEDIDAGLRSGSLKFTMYGTKMHGNWTLVRMGGKAADEKKPNWLLIKEHDEFEAAESSKPITDSQPNSVVTNRSLDQIAASEDHVWNSKDTAKGSAWFKNDQPKSATSKPKSKQPSTLISADLAAAPKEAFPGFIDPQLASEASTAPTTDGWIHELKLDGYRIQAHKQAAAVQLLTRSGLDWTHRMQPLANSIAALPIASAILDGEVVVLNPDGTSNFADLQAAFPTGNRVAAKNALTYFAFDCLHAEGHNLRNLPLLQRKALLEKILATAPESLRFSEHLETSGDLMFHKACELHAEGIVSKKGSAKYISGRTTNWIKLKCIHEQEFVIAGFTLPAKGRAGLPAIGALLLGYYDGQKRLIYAGRTGTGFTQKTHKLLRTRLEALRLKSTPFHDPPAEARQGALWVQPTLVAQVRFATWTATNLLRQASFQGLREDKPAAEVRREELVHDPAGAPSAASQPAAPAAKASGVAKVRAAALTPTAHAPIRLTHPDKVVDPASGLTKQQLADYYWAIAPHLLPHIAGRPLSLVRCPEGSTKPCFFQKHTTTMLPPGVESIAVPDKKTGKPEPYITLSTPEALAGLAQMGVLEIHPWGSRNDDLEHPDRLIIDLDPDAAITWPVLAALANEVRQRFKKLGLTSFLKSTGGKGLHVVVPIAPEHDWPAIKQFTRDFVLALEKSNPRLYLTKMSKAARKDRIYLDYLRNERGATAVAAYSPRARAGAPVSVPLPWSALTQPTPPNFTAIDYTTWLPTLKPNPWKALSTTRQRLTLA